MFKTYLDMVEHGHGDGGDHGHLLVVVLEDEDHVELAEVELDTLEVHALHLGERQDESRLRASEVTSALVVIRYANLLNQVDEAVCGWLEDGCRAERCACIGCHVIPTLQPWSTYHGTTDHRTECRTQRRAQPSPQPDRLSKSDLNQQL